MTKKPNPEDRATRLAWQAADGKAAMREYQARSERLARNTERLRAERLARESAQVDSKPKRSRSRSAGS
ncbi:MAG: hypothetical protein OJF62_000317 [Pseudolabrys sp.]|nr:hypothetical protein [Pseudolabrys sp.]